MQLLPFQKIAVSWLRSRPKAFLALEQGLGKTAVSLSEAQGRILVVCPASLKLNWLREAGLWRPDLTVHVIRKAADKVPADVDMYVVNYDILHRVIAKIPQPDTLILDESHYCKTPTARRTKAAVAIIKKVKRVRLLSGTPVVNRPMELFPLLKAISALSMDWYSYARRYCAAWDTPWGTFDTTGHSNLDELYAKLEPVMYRVTKTAVLPELPAKRYRVIELDVPLGAQEKRLLRRDIELPQHKVAFEALADILRMNAERKLPLVTEFIINALRDEPKVVVFAWHTDIIKELAERLKEYDPQVITGSTSMNARDAAVQEFQHGGSRVFIGNIKAAGTGLTLTAASRVIFAESTWTPADIEQAADRCHRIGQQRPVQIDILTAHRSIDAQQLHAVITKMTVIDQIIKETPHMNTLDRLIAMRDELTAIIEQETATTPKETTATLDEVRLRAAAAIETHGQDLVLDLLKTHGAQKLSDLDESSRQAFYEALPHD